MAARIYMLIYLLGISRVFYLFRYLWNWDLRVLCCLHDLGSVDSSVWQCFVTYLCPNDCWCLDRGLKYCTVFCDLCAVFLRLEFFPGWDDSLRWRQNFYLTILWFLHNLHLFWLLNVLYGVCFGTSEFLGGFLVYFCECFEKKENVKTGTKFLFKKRCFGACGNCGVPESSTVPS